MSKEYKVNKNDLEILRGLYQNQEGLRVVTISKLTNLKTITIYKRLSRLKEKGLVENIFPIWKIVNGQLDFIQSSLKESNTFEIHNLSYVLKLIKTPEWWKTRKNRLIKLKGFQFTNINFGKGNSNPYQQLINDNFVIQTYPQSIIIICRKRYYGNNPYEVIINAMNEVLDLIGWFEERMRFKFFPEGIPCLEIRNNDYNRIKDILTKYFKRKDKRFLIELDKNRKVWIDYSEPFGKESNYPEAQEILESFNKDLLINSDPKNPIKMSEVITLVGKVTQNQMAFAHNLESHIEAIQTLSKSVKELKEEVKKINRR